MLNSELHQTSYTIIDLQFIELKYCVRLSFILVAKIFQSSEQIDLNQSILFKPMIIFLSVCNLYFRLILYSASILISRIWTFGRPFNRFELGT